MNTRAEAVKASLIELMGRPKAFEQRFPAWQRECAAVLASLSATEQESLLFELQKLIEENRSLFEQESNALIRALAGEHDSGQKTRGDRARRYADIGKLGSEDDRGN